MLGRVYVCPENVAIYDVPLSPLTFVFWGFCFVGFQKKPYNVKCFSDFLVFCLYVLYGKSLLLTGLGCERTCLLSVRMAVACPGMESGYGQG